MPLHQDSLTENSLVTQIFLSYSSLAFTVELSHPLLHFKFLLGLELYFRFNFILILWSLKEDFAVYLRNIQRDCIFFLFTIANKYKVTSFLKVVENLWFCLHTLYLLSFYLYAVMHCKFHAKLQIMWCKFALYQGTYCIYRDFQITRISLCTLLLDSFSGKPVIKL